MARSPSIMEAAKEVSDDVDSTLILTAVEEKALMRRVDMHLMPLMFISDMLQLLDKIALGYTTIMEMLKDTGLEGSQYSWVSSVFYFGYLAASPLASLAFVKLPLGKFLSISILIWGVILGCHGAASNFAVLLTVRLLLGVFESTISPGFSLITGLWYKPSEHASRHAVWFAGNSVAGLIGGLVAYGINSIQGPVAPWRWLFIIFGTITCAWGTVLYFFLPDSPLKARFLTPAERVYVYKRAQEKTHSFKVTEWKKSQVFEALSDPKTWCLFVYTVATSFPNAGLTNFGSLIVQGFGFSTFTTLLLSMPGAAFNLFFVVLGSAIAAKIPKSRCIVIAVAQIISLIGVLIVNELPTSNKWGRLCGIWLMYAFTAGFPISLSLIASNVQGYTKKTTTSAVLFVGYCAGNIAGPQLYFPAEAPGYRSAFLAVYVAFGVASVTIVAMRQYMAWENSSRDREQGVNSETNRMDDDGVLHVAIGVDETDRENRSFRYFL